MSENPYRSTPSSHTPVGVYSQQKPTGLTVIAVICLVIGILGVLVAIVGLIILPFQEFINQRQIGQSGMPGADFQAKIAEVQQTQFIPKMITRGCKMIAGTLLFIGSVGVLSLKRWGRNLLRNALLVATVFVVLRGIYGMWAQYTYMGAVQEILQSQGNADTFGAELQTGFGIGMMFNLLWLIGLSAFYLWSRMYLNKPPIRALFDAAS